MKPKSMKTILLAALLAPGALFAQTTATTTPVGYETLAITSGFNYLGLRLHTPSLYTGTLETVTTNSVTDTQGTFSFSAAKNYILEINGVSGAISQFLGSSATSTSISLVDNLSALGVTSGASYTIREAATLASVFGVSNSAGLTEGFGGITGADVVFVPNGAGGFDQYYFDSLEGSWANVSGAPVTASDIPLVYVDGVVISSTKSLNLVVSGEIKKTSTSVVASSGFNYLGSIYPAGATLASTYGSAVASLDQGFGGITGADVFFVPNGSGGFNQYYYDSLEGSWANESGVAVDAATIALPSGVVFSNEGSPVSLLTTAPSNYSTL